MLIEITHASFSSAKGGSPFTELGAMSQSKVIWRASLEEVIARIHTGVRFFVRFEGAAVAVQLVQSTALRDAHLRTAADKTTFELLRHLPQLPQNREPFARW